MINFLKLIRSDNIFVFTLNIAIYSCVGVLLFIAPNIFLKKLELGAQLESSTSALCGIFFVVAFTFFYRTVVLGKDLGDTGVSTNNIRVIDLISGILVGAGTLFVVLILIGFDLHSALRNFPIWEMEWKLILLYLTFWLFQCATEEVIFRGYLGRAFAERFNVMFSCVAVGAIFAYFHQDSEGFNAIMLVNAILMSSCMYIGRLIYGSLLWPIGWHFGWNFFQEYLLNFNPKGIAIAHLHPEASIFLVFALLSTILALSVKIIDLKAFYLNRL